MGRKQRLEKVRCLFVVLSCSFLGHRTWGRGVKPRGPVTGQRAVKWHMKMSSQAQKGNTEMPYYSICFAEPRFNAGIARSHGENPEKRVAEA